MRRSAPAPSFSTRRAPTSSRSPSSRASYQPSTRRAYQSTSASRRASISATRSATPTFRVAPSAPSASQRNTPNVRRRSAPASFSASSPVKRSQSRSTRQTTKIASTNPRSTGLRIDQSKGVSARNHFRTARTTTGATKTYTSSPSTNYSADTAAPIVHNNNSSHSPRQAHHDDHAHHDAHNDHDDHFHHDDHHALHHSYAYGGYAGDHHHASHHGYGYSSHYGFGYGHHYLPGYSFSFSYGLHHYPYYHPYSHYHNYNVYSYGYGYSPYYNGYYSSYYDYCPPVDYDDYNTYYNTTYRTNTYYNTSPAPSTTYSVTPPAHTTTDYYATADNYSNQPFSTGWDALADGRPRTAFRYFSRQASRNLDDGLPKLGYALASAMLGDHQRAAWAMRRAFNSDPYSLTSLRFDKTLLARIDHLAEKYAEKADDITDPNADFMLAALSFLIEDNQLASIAINAAIDHGDTSDAAQNLKQMIPDIALNYDK